MAPKTWGNIVTEGYVPKSISRRQFFQVLADAEIITRQEALDAVTSGAVPQEMADLIDLFDVDERLKWEANMMLAGARDFERSNWLVMAFASAHGMDDEAVDKLWREGAKLV